MATTEERVDNIDLARTIPVEAATHGNIDVIDDVCAPDYVDHGPFGRLEGPEALKAQMRMLREAFPDFTATVEDTVSTGDTVAMRLTLRGTHEGVFMGIEPTKKTFEAGNIILTRIEDGKIAERWVQPDMLGMLEQLGVIESPLEVPGQK